MEVPAELGVFTRAPDTASDRQACGEMRLSTGPEFFNALANHGAVFPAISRKGSVAFDFTPEWGQLLGIEFDTGGWLMHMHAPDRWEVHTLFLPHSIDVKHKAAQTAFFMFTSTDAQELVTKVPADLPHARKLAEAMGFKWMFRREAAWERESGPVDIDYFRLALTDWILGHPKLIEMGQDFHKKLGDHLDHGEDAVHDAYVGFTVACTNAGKIEKGVDTYNRWALLAGYVQVDLRGNEVRFDGLVATSTEDGIEIKEDN